MANRKARRLGEDVTDAERRLWSILRARRLEGYKFRQQHPLGPFIFDFACIEPALTIEADGGQHAGSAHDRRRTAWLERQGWRVLRFWNNDILDNTKGVGEAVARALEALRAAELSKLSTIRPSPSQPFGPGPSLSRFAGEGLLGY